MYKSLFKRSFDIVFALAGFVIFLPFFILITILLFFANDGKPFFFQSRPGKDEYIFRIIKFKTMNDKRDSSGNLLPDVQRLTLMGKLIRRSSVDEVPQLLNVIAGHMSLIGPRPLLPEYLPLYSERQKRRHEVKPGITGWAQVNGRNAITWEEKFDYDVWYVDHLSLILDLKIIWLTIIKVFKTEGISASDKETMIRFNRK